MLSRIKILSGLDGQKSRSTCYWNSAQSLPVFTGVELSTIGTFKFDDANRSFANYGSAELARVSDSCDEQLVPLSRRMPTPEAIA